MSRKVDFYFDVGSPASYLAWTQLPRLCASAGAVLEFRPMLLGGVFQATGNVSPATIPAKRRYADADFNRFAARYQVPFSINPHFPINTLLLMRGASGVQMTMPERLQDYLGGVFDALWVAPRNLNDPAQVAEALSAAGFDPAEILALTNGPETKARLRATTDEAVARGVFGAPTMFVGEQMFFGQDRLDFVAEALS